MLKQGVYTVPCATHLVTYYRACVRK